MKVGHFFGLEGHVSMAYAFFLFVRKLAGIYSGTAIYSFK